MKTKQGMHADCRVVALALVGVLATFESCDAWNKPLSPNELRNQLHLKTSPPITFEGYELLQGMDELLCVAFTAECSDPQDVFDVSHVDLASFESKVLLPDETTRDGFTYNSEKDWWIPARDVLPIKKKRLSDGRSMTIATKKLGENRTRFYVVVFSF